MLSKSLKQSMAEANLAEKDNKSSWDAEEDIRLEIVAANTHPERTVPSIGVQLQRPDGKRRWFDDLRFDESNPRSLKMTGLTLRNLGCGDLIDTLDEQYPVDENDSVETQEANAAAQLQAIASALQGVVFTGSIVAKVNRRTESLPVEEQEYINFFRVKALIEGPTVSPAAPEATKDSKFSGFGGNPMGE